jgi:hypothetical protein
MEGDPKIFDRVYVVGQILDGRSDEDITQAMVQRGTDAKSAKEWVEGLRRNLAPTPNTETRTRDRRLQRLLLLSTQEGKDRPELSAYSQAQQAYNAALLINDGLAEGSTIRGLGGEYAQAVLLEVTSRGHDFLDQAENHDQASSTLGSGSTASSLSAEPQSLPASSKLIFISHSSVDKDLAEALVDMLCAALNLRRRDFLCTSVDGAKLRGGDITDDELRRQIREVPAFLSLLTREAVTSTYVLFELGARWGCAKHHIPLLAKGAGTEVLREPLKERIALQMSSVPSVLQLVEDLGHLLHRQPEPANSYLEKVQDVVRISSTAVSTESKPFNETTQTTSSPKELAPSVAAQAAFRVHSEIRIIHHLGFPQLAIATWVANDGVATAYDVKIACFNEPQAMPGFDHSLWKEGSAPGGRGLFAKEPIHPGDVPNFLTWTFGQAQILVDGQPHPPPAKIVPADTEKTPVIYDGAVIDIRFKIFARNQRPAEVSVQFSKDEIRRLRAKDFVPA